MGEDCNIGVGGRGDTIGSAMSEFWHDLNIDRSDLPATNELVFITYNNLVMDSKYCRIAHLAEDGHFYSADNNENDPPIYPNRWMRIEYPR